MDGSNSDVAVVPALDASFLARMPLAEAALTVWRYVFDDARLQNVWGAFRGRCYDKVLTFPMMTHLIADALLQYGGSGRRAFEKNIEQGQLETSVAAAFGKLGRLPLEVSREFFESGTVALRQLFPDETARELPSSLRDFHVMILDGKTIKNVAKRLKPLRNSRGGLLGGKAVVALEWSRGLAIGLEPHRAGDVSEKRLVAGLVARIRAAVSGSRLFVADRGFCDLVQMQHFTGAPGDHFVVRHHRGLTFTADPKRPEKRGKDALGRTFVETWGWAGSARHKGRRYVRRIQLLRPGDEDLVLLTDLLCAKSYPAQDLLEIYEQRWGIERLFQKVTEVFGLERLIGGRPEACLFQFAFCMLLYNIVQVLTGYIARAQQLDAEQISKEKLFDDVQRELIAWNVLFQPEQTIAYFKDCPAALAVRQRLDKLLANAWSETWWKAPIQRRTEPAPTAKTRSHGSVYRILKDHLRKKRKHPASAPSPRC